MKSVSNRSLPLGLAHNGPPVSASVIAGSAVVVKSVIGHETQPVMLAFLRYLIAAGLVVPLLTFVWPNEQLPAIPPLRIALLGLIFFAVFPWTSNVSLVHTTSARASVAIATLPVQTTLLAWMLASKQVSRGRFVGILLTVAGVASFFPPDIVYDAHSGYIIGDLVMIFTALCAAVYFLASRPVIHRYGPAFVTFLAMITGAIALGALAANIGQFVLSPSVSATGWKGVLFLGSIAGVGQFLLYAWSMKRLAPIPTSLYVSVTLLSAMVLGFLVLGDELSLRLMLGLGLVILGILPSYRGHRR